MRNVISHLIHMWGHRTHGNKAAYLSGCSLKEKKSLIKLFGKHKRAPVRGARHLIKTTQVCAVKKPA